MADLIKGAGENVNVKQFEPTCLVVTHLPKDATKREIESFFNEIGTIRKCHLVRDKDWEFRGMAYVAFARWQDAAKAKEMFQKKPFRGYSLRIKFSRTRKKDLLKKKQSENQTLNKLHSEHFDGEIKERVSRRKAKDRSKYDVNKESRKMRERRIIVRNLSFKATESILEDHFSPYGKIVEVQLPRKDGKLVGIAFLQFETKLQALKAIKQCNMKPLLGRHVAVDIAVPKKKYESQKINLGDALDIKQENIDIKEDTEDAVDEKPVKTFPMDVEIKKEETESEENNSGLEDEEEEDFDDDTDNESIDVDSDEDNDEKSKEGTKQKPKSRKLLDNDVSDGSTIFIKNLSFDAEDDDVLDFFSRFGDVHYVKICVDPLTEHPRGTAFVKFKKKTSADACLAAEADPATKEEFNLLDRQMHVMRAINKNEAQLVKKNKETEKVKDKRNLYLAREGVIRQGTRAAVGVSEADMRLRYSRENAKRRMLKNLNIFVSKTRLCINNIPEYYTEQQLRRIFAKHSDPNAKITEVRIMKNFQDLDDRGQPKSRGYGFVSFKEHEHALNALRKFNNNPHIFSEAKRPVVEFSLENREALNARDKRQAKSREKNPTWNKGKYAKVLNGKDDPQSRKNEWRGPANDNILENTPYMGSKANASTGVEKALSSHIGPKIRHTTKISRKQLKKQKQDRAKGGVKRLRVFGTNNAPVAKKLKSGDLGDAAADKKKKSKKVLPKTFRSELKQDKQFKEMVEKYKKKMALSSHVPTKKWYED